MLERQESGKSLRVALEELIRDNVVVDRRPRDKHGPIGRLPEAKVPTSVLQDLLAAHPAEPAPVVTDEAIDAMEGEVDSWPDDASLPWLPNEGKRASLRRILDAAAPLLGFRTMPTEAQVAEAVAQAWASPDASLGTITAAVLALLNEAES